MTEAADVGLTIEIFGASQLGSDADRVESVISGDIDIDIQGASALSAVYEPMSVVDGAFVFDDSDHLYRFFTSEASDDLKQGFEEATGIHILGAWNTGARQFTANVPINGPDDLQGLRMRFPPSPQFLMNAEAMGAEPVEVAFEELYLALQQGTVDGQENPIVNIDAINLDEVQDYISLSSHQLSSNLVVINAATWDGPQPEQQERARRRPSARPWSRSRIAPQPPRRRSSTAGARAAIWRSSRTSTATRSVEMAEPFLRDALVGGSDRRPRMRSCRPSDGIDAVDRCPGLPRAPTPAVRPSLWLMKRRAAPAAGG